MGLEVIRKSEILIYNFRFANVGFDINSPDSNDSGIQSDARSDDGISHTNGGSVSEDLCAITNKAYQPNKEGDEDSEEVTPTQVKNGKVLLKNFILWLISPKKAF